MHAVTQTVAHTNINDSGRLYCVGLLDISCLAQVCCRPNFVTLPSMDRACQELNALTPQPA